MRNSVQDKDIPIFAHFNKPKNQDLKDDHINVDLNQVLTNIGLPHYNYELFSELYNSNSQIANLIDNFNKEGIFINSQEEEIVSSEPDETQSKQKVSQMAKQATDLSDSPLG